MNDKRLDELLTQAQLPKRSPAYWENFTESTLRKIRRADNAATIKQRPHNFRALIALAAGAACVFAAFLIGFYKGQGHPRDLELMAAQKYLSEVQAMFPNQVRALIFDRRGTHLVLSDTANVPQSPAIFVKLCDGDSCQKALTFSGQEIKWRGETFEVLTSDSGQIILAGDHTVLSTGSRQSKALRMEATTFGRL